jgi:ADP-dependent NAD(P)H-hydrate dehydratase
VDDFSDKPTKPGNSCDFGSEAELADTGPTGRRDASAGIPADLPALPRRQRDATKYDHGRVVVVAGSRGMAGAAALASMATLRSGAGLVEAVVPASIQATVAGFDPCVMTCGLAEDEQGRFAEEGLPEILKRCSRADAVAVGPGLGRSDSLVRIVAELWRALPVPAVFDADGLWALAQLKPTQWADHAGPRVLTPHAGELQRLLGEQTSRAAAQDRAELEQAAVKLACETGSTVVLKGPGTLITDGTHQAHNETGNPGMATAGTGDVLTGIVTALLAQGMKPYEAARLGTWLHGAAGDAAAQADGMSSLTAIDILRKIGGLLP